MLKIKVWAPALASWFAISFTICVIGGLIVPGLPINHEGLELFLPGFTWISVGSFVLGLVETTLYGAVAAVLFVLLHNFFARRVSPTVTPSDFAASTAR